MIEISTQILIKYLGGYMVNEYNFNIHAFDISNQDLKKIETIKQKKQKNIISIPNLYSDIGFVAAHFSASLLIYILTSYIEVTLPPPFSFLHFIEM